MADWKALYNKIKTGRYVYMLDESYDACPKLVSAKVLKKKRKGSYNYGYGYRYGVITTTRGKHYLCDTKVYTSKEAAAPAYLKKLRAYKKRMAHEMKDAQSTVNRVQRQLDEVDWMINKASG